MDEKRKKMHTFDGPQGGPSHGGRPPFDGPQGGPPRGERPPFGGPQGGPPWDRPKFGGPRQEMDLPETEQEEETVDPTSGENAPKEKI